MSANFTNQNNCRITPDNDLKTIASVKAAFGVVSFFLGIVAISLNVLYQKHRFHFHRMILYLGVAVTLNGLTSALNGVDYFFESDAKKTFCIVAGAGNEYSTWVNGMATLSLSFSVSISLMRGRSRSGSTGSRLRFSAVWPLLIFVFPLSFLWIPFVKQAYGQSKNLPWCTIITVDANCSVNQFGKAVHTSFTVLDLLVSGAVFLMFPYQVAVIRRRLREWNIDPEHKRVMKWDGVAISLVVLTFFVRFIIIVINLVINEISGYAPVMWYVYATHPTLVLAPVPILLTVDRGMCTWRGLRGAPLLGKNSCVTKYHCVALRDESTFHESSIKIY